MRPDFSIDEKTRIFATLTDLSVKMGEVRQQLKDWTIPEFKAEIFARFAKIENELGKLNGERIGKIEKNVCELRDSHTRLKQTWTVLSIIGTIIAAVIGLVIGLWEARK